MLVRQYQWRKKIIFIPSNEWENLKNVLFYKQQTAYTKWPKWVRNDQKGYEITWERIDHYIVISYPVDLGTK